MSDQKSQKWTARQQEMARRRPLKRLMAPLQGRIFLYRRGLAVRKKDRNLLSSLGSAILEMAESQMGRIILATALLSAAWFLTR